MTNIASNAGSAKRPRPTTEFTFGSRTYTATQPKIAHFQHAEREVRALPQDGAGNPVIGLQAAETLEYIGRAMLGADQWTQVQAQLLDDDAVDSPELYVEINRVMTHFAPLIKREMQAMSLTPAGAAPVDPRTRPERRAAVKATPPAKKAAAKKATAPAAKGARGK